MVKKIVEKFRGLQIKGFVAGMLAAVILLSSGTALANTINRSIDVIFRDIRLVVDGQPFTPRDAQGRVVEPFIFEGTTFLPVRAVSDALGIPVGWDGITSTVYLGNVPGGAPFFATVPEFEGSGLRTGTVNMQGNPFPNALNNSFTHSGSWGHRNLNGQFNTITGTIGRIDGSGNAARTISFIGDGRELASFNVDGTTPPTAISVDVRGVLILRIEIAASSGGGARIAFANAMIE